MLYISRNLALISTVADRLLVMYAGEIVEAGTTRDVVHDPRHPYTQVLLAALPSAHECRAVRGLAGRPPSQVVIDRCAFAPRCRYAQSECVAEHPILQPLPGPREVRCVRRDELELSAQSVEGWAMPAEPQPSRILELEGVWCQYRKQTEPALSDFSLSIARGDTVAVVGESGSGKDSPTSNVHFEVHDL